MTRSPRASRRLGFALAIALLAGGSYAIASTWTNLREVEPGKFYRSGQLSDAQLRSTIDAFGIKTIINLRGSKSGRDWYDAERAVAGEKGVRLIDVKMRSHRIPHRETLIELLDAYRDAERPILVHCFSGADRAGQASAIYQIEYMGTPVDEALDMLSPRFLHVSWLKPAMRYFIGIYRGAEWARSTYDPCRADYRYYDKSKYCRG